jgi:hypothetical protein
MMKNKVLIAGFIVTIILAASLTALAGSSSSIDFRNKEKIQDPEVNDEQPLDISMFRYVGWVKNLQQDEDGDWTATAVRYVLMIGMANPPVVITVFKNGEEFEFDNPFGRTSWKRRSLIGDYFIWPLVDYN